MKERVQKIISKTGIASRREAEALIKDGLVTVNGQIVTLGAKADPFIDYIKVRDKLITKLEPPVYIMFYKPKGCLTTMYDPEGRQTIKAYLRGLKYRVYPVGRLDYNSEGLLLLTNDGDFANHIIHPKNSIPRTYLAKITGPLDDQAIEKLTKGVRLEDGLARAVQIRKVRRLQANTWLEITVNEGRNRLIRRMMQQVGHTVKVLKRIRIGNLYLGAMPAGKLRHLTNDEVKGLLTY
ncbi:MAG TPA: pseudouridine synthase [Thermodesulfovibrionia bacterium]|nr:pseudouridine synthase [Thermodesulfovibrionia bacterium]